MDSRGIALAPVRDEVRYARQYRVFSHGLHPSPRRILAVLWPKRPVRNRPVTARRARRPRPQRHARARSPGHLPDDDEDLDAAAPPRGAA
jgi:hypothetical protein